jgi:hypothetical protein
MVMVLVPVPVPILIGVCEVDSVPILIVAVASVIACPKLSVPLVIFAFTETVLPLISVELPVEPTLPIVIFLLLSAVPISIAPVCADPVPILIAWDEEVESVRPIFMFPLVPLSPIFIFPEAVGRSKTLLPLIAVLPPPVTPIVIVLLEDPVPILIDPVLAVAVPIFSTPAVSSIVSNLLMVWTPVASILPPLVETPPEVFE